MRIRPAVCPLHAAQAEQTDMTPLSDEPVQKPFILNNNEERILQAVHDVEMRYPR